MATPGTRFFAHVAMTSLRAGGGFSRNGFAVVLYDVTVRVLPMCV
jgi:hypothetical protein